MSASAACGRGAPGPHARGCAHFPGVHRMECACGLGWIGEGLAAAGGFDAHRLACPAERAAARASAKTFQEV